MTAAASAVAWASLGVHQVWCILGCAHRPVTRHFGGQHSLADSDAVQAAAKVVSTDKGAQTFWLTEAQADVLAHETDTKASPAFMAGNAPRAHLSAWG